MKREILINAAPRETRIAILEDGKLVELLVDRPDNRRMVGDIYLGRVDAVLPGIQAAFVDIGTEKSAFLHASDLVRETAEEAEDEDDDEEQTDELPEKKNGNGSNGNGRRAKAPLIQEALKRGQDILVQVSKEPISTKGPRVTAQISLAGRFLVYIPDSSKVGVSRKIGSSAERARLKEQVQNVVDGFIRLHGATLARGLLNLLLPEAAELSSRTGADEVSRTRGNKVCAHLGESRAVDFRECIGRRPAVGPARAGEHAYIRGEILFNVKAESVFDLLAVAHIIDIGRAAIGGREIQRILKAGHHRTVVKGE